ncbi:hypothetical protein HWV62_11391 [Athelia sp. TMB]|nr:hypothetical protein HWV62_11391 [Athelia sp. TMB]
MSTTTLTLQSDCPWKTCIMDAEGYIVYDIRTVFHGDTNYTTICGENEDILATLRWRDLFADEIMLPGRGDTSFSSVRKWLKKSVVPLN